MDEAICPRCKTTKYRNPSMVLMVNTCGHTLYNRQEEEFSGLREYNDYLEEVETIIFNLSNNVDVELTKKKVEEYQKSNKSNIQRNRSKLEGLEAIFVL
ncbi:MNAT1 [Branchiostoma lanceolatum]|uniref:MNAT1 protein n=1 Tax=Branchiostoma lanceolatum TaxID=7740 RepID=A0A8S4MNC7_BRALA|nr:MNAT1 [Branchiostoma lanceolatum]